MNKDYGVFTLSFILRAIGLGIFTTLFNLYILSENRFSENFLELFLALGNLSMAFSSYFVGILIDKFNKKKLIILFTVLCSFCMLLEIIQTNKIFMYLISIVYGIGATGLYTLTPPILKKYENGKRKNLIVINRAINIISVTVGALMAGALTGPKMELSSFTVLLIVPALYMLSAIVYLFYSENKFETKGELFASPSTYRSDVCYHLTAKFLILTILSFVLLGFAPMLVNYVNVYFRNRFDLNVSKIAYIYAAINLLSGIFITILSKINFNRVKSFSVLFISIVLVNILLILCTNLAIQLTCVFLYIGLFEILTSCLYEFVLSKGREEVHGRLSGVIQTSCNLSETLGIYACGWMLEHKIYEVIFGLGIVSTVMGAIMIIYLLKEENGLICAEKKIND